MANSFDDKSTQRIARTVRLVEKSPLNSPTYRRRSRSRSVSPEVAAGNFFPVIVRTVSTTTITANKLSDPTGPTFLVTPLSYQNVNIEIGAVISATDYTAITL